MGEGKTLEQMRRPEIPCVSELLRPGQRGMMIRNT